MGLFHKSGVLLCPSPFSSPMERERMNYKRGLMGRFPSGTGGVSPVPCACIRLWRPSAAFVQRHKSSISVSLTTSGQRACGTREKPERRCGRRIRDTRAPAGRGSKRQAHDARYRALGQALCHRILPLLLHFSFFAMLRLDIVRLLYSISPGEHVQLVKIIDQRQ